ncbi:hypothetical protein BC831DRAFT_491026 [Entophlyctis helioformis]|nr:hypothetical protein BC831DRAFT_491026 [Entophlyctis helioformis]
MRCAFGRACSVGGICLWTFKLRTRTARCSDCTGCGARRCCVGCIKGRPDDSMSCSMAGKVVV